MKQWKLLLAALLCVLLVCISVSALAACAQPHDGTQDPDQTYVVQAEPKYYQIPGDKVNHRVVRMVTRYCLQCDAQIGDPFESDYTLPHDNAPISSWLKSPKSVAKTCTTAGKNVWYCSICGFEKSEDVPASHNKVHVDYKGVDQCGQVGNYEYYKCKDCGKLWDQFGNPIDAVPTLKIADDHNWAPVVGNPEKDATCTVDGYYIAKCANPGCTATKRVTIPAYGHTMPEWGASVNYYKEPTCYQEGYETRECARVGCDYYEIKSMPKLEHKFNDAKAQYNANPASPLVKKAPTCTAEGQIILLCQNAGCQFSKTAAIPALGHQWGAWEEVAFTGKQCICTDDRMAKRTCQRGGDCSEKTNSTTGKIEYKTLQKAIGHNYYISEETDTYYILICHNFGCTDSPKKIYKDAQREVDPIDPIKMAEKHTPAPTPKLNYDPEKTDDPKPTDSGKPTGKPTDKPTESGKPVVDPTTAPNKTVSRTEGRVFETNTYTVASMQIGQTYTMPLIDKAGKQVGTVKFTVDKNTLKVTYKVYDTKGKEIAVNADTFALRLYASMKDAQTNGNYDLWTPDVAAVPVEGADPKANTLVLYMIVDHMNLK